MINPFKVMSVAQLAVVADGGRVAFGNGLGRRL
jgi:hypothetical protein